jgi:hypothetical protein
MPSNMLPLNAEVTINQRGKVVGRTEFADGAVKYLVEFDGKKHDREWISAARLQEVDNGL